MLTNLGVEHPADSTAAKASATSSREPTRSAVSPRAIEGGRGVVAGQSSVVFLGVSSMSLTAMSRSALSMVPWKLLKVSTRQRSGPQYMRLGSVA